MRRLGFAACAVLGLATGCGHRPAPTSAPVVFTGDLRGPYHSGAPSECGPGATTVTGWVGEDSKASPTDLVVSNDGSLRLFSINLGVIYSGKGVAFRPGIGWDIDATAYAGTRTVRVTGHLSC